MNNRLINTKVAGGGGCTDIVDNYDPFGGNGVALYQLNGDATDVSTNYNGTWSGTESYTTGVFGQAGVFDGSSSYISGLPTLTNVSTAFTVSLWLHYTTNPSSGFKYVFGGIKEQGAEDSLVGIIVNDLGNIGYLTRGSNSGTLHQIITSEDFTNGWHNVVITSDSTSMSLYVDGSNINTLSVSPTITVDNSVLGAINSRGTIEEYFPCSIDQVRIFNTALTPLEIEALYTEELCICDGTVDTLDILGDGSCIATYQLDGNANDLSGNYSGTPTDVSYGVGEFDLAGVFNGSSSKILASVPKSSSQSFSFWTKHGTQSNSTATYLGYSNTASNGFFSLCISSGNFSILYWNGTTYARNTSTTSITDNTWHHVVLNTVGNVFTIYLDGNSTPVYTTTLSGFTHATRSDLQISFETPDGAASYFNGEIDQVRIFNKALSAGEVTTLYNETACTVIPPTYSTYSAYFNGLDEYITRTPPTASNRQIFTINFWFNTSQTTRGFVINQGNDGNDFFAIEINNGKINCGGYDGSNTIVLGTIDTYNDGKWHNYQIAIDTTQATSTNRAKVYIDGVQITSFSTGGNGVVYPSLNYSFQFNTTKTLQIGRLVNSNALYYDGYISSMSVVDGQQLTADSFIEYDAPKWIPKEYTGSYGTNGFFLNFSDADELGTDTSGNGNNFTEVNMDSSNQHNNFYR